MIILDASLLVAHLSPHDAHHPVATRVLLDAAAERFVVHALTLAEVLVGGVRIGKGTDMLADLRALGVELAPRDDDEPLRLAELRVSTGLKLPDCCVLGTALVHEAPLATFDQALASAARARGLVVVA